MLKIVKKLVCLTIMLTLVMSFSISAFAVTYANNVIYLPHGYFCTAKTDAFIQSEVNAYKVNSMNYQMCNLAAFNSDGTMNADNYNQLAHWIQISKQTDPNQKVIGYVNGTKTLVDNVAAHQNMVDFCAYLVNTLGCDGIHLDFEPVPADDPTYLSFMQKVKAAIGTKHLSVATPMSNWTSGFITQVSNAIDMMCVMCYDTQSASASAYISYMKQTVQNYSAAKSASCQLNPIQAAYRRSRYHDPSIESIINGSSAIDQAVAAGASVYGSGVWWWYEMTDVDKANWVANWVR